ncbi:MAG: peptide ABC transporter substrate-binding protein, partial [Anaerolineae bacterium]|nr:peptide ABC transporter substrate-binding protein [Anaerolineae bacterium]
IALVVSLLSLVLALAACRREETATPAPAPTSTTAAALPAAPSATQAPAPAQGGAPTQAPSAASAQPPVGKAAAPASQSAPQTLRVNLGDLGRASGAEPGTIDPQKASFGPEIAVVMLAFENLLTLDAQGKLIPAAAEALPQVSPDGLVYTFKLRDGLKYSDGQPLRAKDFEYGWKRHLDPQTASPAANYGYAIKGAQAFNTADPAKVGKEELQKLRDAVGVKALDERTLQFTLEKPAAYFPSVLTTSNGLPTRQDIVEKGGEKWTEPATYIGNGPFVLSEWEHGVKLVFTPNKNYRLGPPSLSRFEYAMIAEPAAAFTAYLNHELDAADVGAGEAASIQTQPELKKQWTVQPGPNTLWLLFVTSKKPFDNVKVRQAFNQAIDHETLVRDVLQGVGVAAYQLVPPDLVGYYPDLPTPKFNPTAARQLLAEAGYPDGKGFPDITLSYAPLPLIPQRVFEFIQAQLKANLGVNIKLEPMDFKAYIGTFPKAETAFQMYWSGETAAYNDPQAWYSLLWPSTQTFQPNGWKSAEYDRLTAQADAETDPAKRQGLYQQAAQILINAGPAFFLFHPPASFVMQPWVEGCQFTPFELFPCQATIMQVRIAPH